MHAVVVLLATACVAEMADAPEGVETDIFLTIDIEDAPATRAISDGTSVDKLIYAVMTAEGEFVSRSEKTFPSGVPASGEVKMTVSLAGGVSYKLVCWAQSGLCDAYSLSDDMILSVNYAGAANDELRDAFFGVSDVFTLSDRTASVTLKRPFAQLNAGTHVFDWEYVTGFHDFDVRTSTARVRGVADKLNLLDGTVSGSVDAQFTPSALPAQMLRTDVDENGNETDYTGDLIKADAVIKELYGGNFIGNEEFTFAEDSYNITLTKKRVEGVKVVFYEYQNDEELIVSMTLRYNTWHLADGFRERYDIRWDAHPLYSFYQFAPNIVSCRWGSDSYCLRPDLAAEIFLMLDDMTAYLREEVREISYKVRQEMLCRQVEMNSVLAAVKEAGFKYYRLWVNSTRTIALHVKLSGNREVDVTLYSRQINEKPDVLIKDLKAAEKGEETELPCRIYEASGKWDVIQ